MYNCALELLDAFVSRRLLVKVRGYTSTAAFNNSYNQEVLEPYKCYFTVNMGEGNFYRSSQQPTQIFAL
jgi:hypothetical protein